MKSAWSELLPLALRHGLQPRGWSPSEVAARLTQKGKLSRDEQLVLADICLRHDIPVEAGEAKVGGEVTETTILYVLRRETTKPYFQTKGVSARHIGRIVGRGARQVGYTLRQLRERGDVVTVSAGDGAKPKRWLPVGVGGR